MAIKLVIFDLDGTLIDTLEGIVQAMNIVLLQSGYELPSKEAYQYFIGNGLKNLVRKVLPKDINSEEEVQQIYEEMIRVYSRDWEYGIIIYDGLLPVIQKLAQQGIKFGVHTNKDQTIARKMVKHLFEEIEFLEILGASGDYPLKPNPEGALAIAVLAGVLPEECLYIGDSEVDVQTAKAAGMHSLSVLWGLRTKADIEPYHPDGFIQQANEILPFIQELTKIKED